MSFVISNRQLQQVRKISEGGFAFVSVVRDAATREEFALKKMALQSRALKEMAEREIRVMEMLGTHEHIVQYYGSVFDGSSCAILMELCPNGHLLDLLERKKYRLGEAEILHWTKQIALGLEHMHELGWQHRDLKIENVVLGTDHRAKLCDFGSASCSEVEDPTKLSDQAFAELQEQIEKTTTLSYRPPELVDLHQGFPIGTPIDVWDLGCVLFTLAFAAHPFQDEGSLAILNVRYRVPEKRIGVHSDKLECFVHSLLAQHPLERPTVAEVCKSIAKWDSKPHIELPAETIARLKRLERLYRVRIPQNLVEKPGTARPSGTTTSGEGAGVPMGEEDVGGPPASDAEAPADGERPPGAARKKKKRGDSTEVPDASAFFAGDTAGAPGRSGEGVFPGADHPSASEGSTRRKRKKKKTEDFFPEGGEQFPQDGTSFFTEFEKPAGPDQTRSAGNTTSPSAAAEGPKSPDGPGGRAAPPAGGPSSPFSPFSSSAARADSPFSGAGMQPPPAGGAAPAGPQSPPKKRFSNLPDDHYLNSVGDLNELSSVRFSNVLSADGSAINIGHQPVVGEVVSPFSGNRTALSADNSLAVLLDHQITTAQLQQDCLRLAAQTNLLDGVANRPDIRLGGSPAVSP